MQIVTNNLSMDSKSRPWCQVDLGMSRVMTEAASVPVWEYVVGLCLLLVVALYHILDFHFVGDLVTGLRGDVVQLAFNPSSKVTAHLLSKCGILMQRYWPTPWLCSPHLQTSFLHFFGRAPTVDYCRQLYFTPDGGTIALDWVYPAGTTEQTRASDTTPTVVVIPGLTSDSRDPYVKHLVRSLSQKGWRVLVANHRGLAGVSITSNCFYNAGWTDDIRRIIGYVHEGYPKAPLFAVGTSIGANILVKYLGEEGEATPLGGAVAVSCPWDLVICDRFLRRRGLQMLYNKALSIGLRDFAKQHQKAAHMIDWELVRKSRTVRDFDNYFTRLVGNYETVDTYYRHCSSVRFLGTVAVPLLCVHSLDDPLCTKEAIPWDECSANPNVVLGVTNHGGHLAFFEGFTAKSIWWVRCSSEFLGALVSSSLAHKQKQLPKEPTSPLESGIDKGPYLDFSKDGKVSAGKSYLKEAVQGDSSEGVDKAATSSESGEQQESTMVGACTDAASDLQGPENNDPQLENHTEQAQAVGTKESSTSVNPESGMITLHFKSRSELDALQSALSQILEQIQAYSHLSQHAKLSATQGVEVAMPLGIASAFAKQEPAQNDDSLIVPVTKDIKKLSTESKRTLWLLAYVAFVTTYPVFGPVLVARLGDKFHRAISRRFYG